MPVVDIELVSLTKNKPVKNPMDRIITKEAMKIFISFGNVESRPL
jgi:hypothetical protein